MKNRRMCTKCVNDTTVKHITFDSEGVCSFCNGYKEIEDKLHDYSRLEELFLSRIKNEGNHAYDVALGFSGGKDSTYVLYQLVHKYKLHVKAYTLDNGFLSEEAKKKIQRIVTELHVEHEFVECDMELLKDMYHHIAKKLLSPCIACSFLGYAVMINYATKIDAAVGIHGRSIPQMLRAYQKEDTDYFKPFITDGLSDTPMDSAKLYENVLGLMDQLVDKSLAERIRKELLCDGFEKGFRPFISYFLYHSYDQKEVVQFLIENTSWRVESEEEHFDCEIHHGALYLKNITARRSHLMPEISVMVREGTITRDEALKRLEIKDDKEVSIKELKRFCSYAGLSYKSLMLKAKIYSKRWW